MSNIIVTVDHPAQQRQITTKDGRVLHLREQPALFAYPDGQVVRHAIGLANDQAEYPAGRYVLDLPSSMYPGKYGPQLSRTLALRRAEPAASSKTGTNG